MSAFGIWDVEGKKSGIWELGKRRKKKWEIGKLTQKKIRILEMSIPVFPSSIAFTLKKLSDIIETGYTIYILQVNDVKFGV